MTGRGRPHANSKIFGGVPVRFGAIQKQKPTSKSVALLVALGFVIPCPVVRSRAKVGGFFFLLEAAILLGFCPSLLLGALQCVCDGGRGDYALKGHCSTT